MEAADKIPAELKSYRRARALHVGE